MKFVKILHGFLLVLGAILTTGLLQPVYGQEPKPGCDPEFMDAMEAKSYLGVQRRISQNQNLIFKPDSVLEYSCFNQHIGYIADGPGWRFSEDDTSWGDITAISNQTLDFALFETVTTPLLNYLGMNFSPRFLNERMPNPGGPAPAYGTYDCQAMQAVWGTARCFQFNANEDTDGFYDFPWYANNDPRQIPQQYGACQQPNNISEAITNAYMATGDDSGQEFRLFVLETENDPAADGTPYEEDPMTVNQITDAMLPGDCANSLKIPTGVMVDVPGRTAYQENVCLTPACSYNGSNCIID